ncbi:hypothetical protein GCK72_021588 [Caenorhabditis remanei]|uniref:Tudor domain-containing protein n=1 Tax=Caenorhabditis remanei TaxID=31234 RepID=A0A6A5GK94_CAERE|nr:hypothetical protein GCK72_021588 [Caenorhabditis remanei]KAF1755021.1 hypothetical protein GCK72_021588 [Caenorhabditis remanei]
MEFGGGLGRFAISPPIQNLCREIVEVPGGSEWRIRKLQEDFDGFCWKYAGASVIVNYHFRRLQTSTTPEDENLKMFYAKVSHFMSPVEISLQPKYLTSARKSIMNQLNAAYQSALSRPDGFQEDQIFVPVACAVQELGIWYRGRISQISGKEHVVVELVDFGTQILVPRHHILPLLRRFGRAPPLCLKCKTDGLSINDLEIKDLHDFKDIVSECNALFRVEIKSMDEPFLIDLYHPTISGLNVCERFLPPPEDTAKLDRIERSWDAHCKKMNEEVEDDEDFEEEHGDYFPSPICPKSPGLQIPREISPRVKYISRLPKCPRAPRFQQDTLHVEHIENSQLIYLQYPYQIEKRAELDEFLCVTWPRLPRIPLEMRKEGQVIAIRNPRFNAVRRGIIIDESTVLLVDYGRFVKCPKKSDLRLMPAVGFVLEEPMLTIISLTRGVNMHTPHHSETLFLRQKLPRGTPIYFKWDKKSKATPLRGKLTKKGQKEAMNDQMVKNLKSRKIDGTCRQLDIYRPRDNHVLPRGTHVYHATCHPHYSKGNEEFVWI